MSEAADSPPKSPELLDSSAPSPEELATDPLHQARQVAAGLLAVAAGLYDAWVIGNARGFDISFDTVLVLTGLYLVSGASGLMNVVRSRPQPGTK